MGHARDRLERSHSDFQQSYLPRVVTIKLQDKIKVRCLMKGEPLLFHLILKQGITWLTLATGMQETVQIKLQNNITKIKNGLHIET